MSLHSTPRGRRRIRSGAALAVGLTVALGSGLPAWAQPVIPDSPLQDSSSSGPALVTPEVQKAHGQIAAFVQLKGQGAYQATQPSEVLAGRSKPVDAQRTVDGIASEVQNKAHEISSDSGTRLLYTTHNALRGVAVKGDAQSVRELAGRSDVAKISLITPKKPSSTAGTDIDTKALNTWENTGHTGKGVTVAVIDSGLDYTHADFGGPGTAAAYQKAQASKTMVKGTYDPQKFVGGYDLAGDAYNAEDPAAAAQPDENPLDCSAGEGHGTHVAGIAAGYGLTKDGKTFHGDYTKLTAQQLQAMKIGPGAAPQAKLVSLRVFGCEGSTNLAGEALDRALDPNQDGKFDDRANIVNMSLGSDYGPYDDPENDIIGALARQGVLSTIASGNAGDVYDIGGNPGNAMASLTVANSFGSTAVADQAEVLAPERLKGKVTGDYSGSYDYSSAKPEDLTGDVVMAEASNKYGCEPFHQDLSGKWVWLSWSDDPHQQYPCGSKVRFDAAQKAGAKGVLMSSPVESDTAGIAGNAGIPGMRLSKSSSDKLRAAAQDGTLRVRMSANGLGASTVKSGRLDQLNPSSSRNEHGSHGLIKPDVAAPGTGIGSAGVGSGTGAKTMTGTSMATPHVAGVAALVKEAHPDYSATQLKAAIMNTATTDVKNEDGAVYSVERVGSGRVNALKAVQDKVFAYNADQPSAVSAAFGVQEVSGAKRTFTRKVTLENSDNAAHTYAVSYAESASMPGVSITATPSVTVPAHGKKTITVTATVDPSALEKTMDPATEKIQLEQARQYLGSSSGRIVLTEGKDTLRVPVQIAPKPTADMAVDGSAVYFHADQQKTDLKLTGSELDHGGYVSSLAALQLGAKSDRLRTGSLPAASVQQADLQYVGASSNIPALKDAKKDASTGTLGFGISTWGSIDSIMPSTTFEVAIDTNKDGQADYFLYNGTSEGLDYPQAKLAKVVDGKAQEVDTLPINGSWGDVDTNTMDTNAFVLPVSAAKLGIDPSKAQDLQYQVHSYSWLQPDAVDSTDWISYNPVNPKLSFTAKNSTGDVAVNDVLVKDSAETTLTAHRAKNATDVPQALFLHLHNATGDLSGTRKGEDGAKAQVMDVQAKGTAISDPRYKDVARTDADYDAIAWLNHRDIDHGYPDGTFRPKAATDRASMASWLYHAAGSPQYTEPAKSRFTDVKPGDRYYKEINWVADQGLNGTASGTFRPRDKVTRAETAAFLYRAAGSPEYRAPLKPTFSDVKPGAPSYKEISWLTEKGIATGYPDGTFRASGSVDRGSMAEIFYRADQAE